MSSNGGNAQANARAAAAAKGQAETQAQEQRNAQQKAQSQARSAQLTGTPQSHGFDAAGNRLNDKGQIVQFASRQSQETYLSDRGVGNNGIILDQSKAENADFSGLAGISNARQQSSTVSSTFKPEENYGYTSKVSPIVSQNFDKNPLESNYDLVKNKSAIQARNSFKSQFSSDQGGVQTKQSEGKSFGYVWAGKQSESIGAKIFTNQESFSRGSAKESQAKQTAAEKAFSNTPSTSNKDYATGGTKDVDSIVSIGKAQRVFGNDKTSFGWSDISKDQLVRDSTQEKALNTTLGARNTFKEGQGTPFSGGLTDKSQTKNASDVFFSSQSPQKQSSVLVSKAQEQTQDFNTFFSGAESRGSIINIYNAQGAKVGSVKANEQGRQTLESLGDTQGIYFREDRGSSGYSRNTDFINTISTLGNQGATINIFNSKNQLVGSVSGPNAYRDYEKQFGKSQETLFVEPVFSTTREGRQTTANLISSAREVGATSISVFSTEKGKPAKEIESVPLNSLSVSSALDRYVGNPNISFGANPKQIQNPKDTTLVPASVTALDLAFVNNKANTGKYFDLNQQVQGFLSNLNKESKLPATAPGETVNLFGIKIANPSTTLYEAGQNFGSVIVGGVKSIPPLAAGLGTSYYNFFTKGSTGGPAVKVDSPKALANVIGASFLAPDIFMGKQATENFQGTSEFIHSNIGVPLKQQGFVIPQTVQNPKTAGSFVGTVAGVGTMLAPLAKVIPVRVAGEAGTIAFPGIGRIKSAGPLAGSEPYVQGPKTITITGVTLGYGGAKTVMLYGKSSEGKSFILSRLSPKFNPETGKENLHLETYYSSAERGSPFPESTKLTLSKLANEKTGSVFEQIKNDKGISKFSQSEFDLELKAKEANKYYNKIPNQKVSEERSNEFFKTTSITEDPKITVQSKQIAQSLQTRSSATKNAGKALLSGDTKLASSYGTFAVSPLQPAKGSPIVVGQISEFNAKQERANLIAQPEASSVKDIDIELTRERQSDSLLNILNAKVERPEGYQFSKQGTNIYYGLEGEKGKEVFNLLGDKDVNPTDLSTSAGSGVFGKAYPTKTAQLGDFKTKTIGYQARALTNSLSATHNLELIEKTKETTEPQVFAGIQGRLDKSEHIVTAFTPRLTKDLSRNVAVLDYGIKTAKSSKARQAFTEYRNALLEKHQYVELENVSPSELSKQLDINKSATKNKETGSILSNNKSNAIITSQFGSNTSQNVSSKSLSSSRSAFNSESSKTNSISAKSSKSARSIGSIISTKSVSSILSTKSSKSTTSSKSSKSTGSTKSVFSPSGFSPISPISSKSSSPASPFSSSTSSSSPGSPSSLSGSPGSPFSFPEYPQSTMTIKIPLPKLGNLGIKRKNKIGSGPTGIIQLNVHNIFASSLDIEVPRNRRVLF